MTSHPHFLNRRRTPSGCIGLGDAAGWERGIERGGEEQKWKGVTHGDSEFLKKKGGFGVN